MLIQWVFDRDIDGKQLIEMSNSNGMIANSVKNWATEQNTLQFDEHALSTNCFLLQILYKGKYSQMSELQVQQQSQQRNYLLLKT